MDESDEGTGLADVIGNVIEVDLDAETEVEAEPADQTSDGDTDEDPQASSEGEDAHPEDEVDAETPTPTLEPFSFRAHGTEFDVPGAVIQEMDDGEGGKVEWIAMPRSAFQESVQPHLADMSAIRRQEETFKRQISDLDPTKNPVVVEAMSLLEGWKEVQALEPDDLAAWIENGKDNMERLKLEAENKALRESREAQTAEPDYSQLISETESDLPGQVALAMGRTNIELPASSQKEVADRLWSRIQRGEQIYVHGEEWDLPPGELGVQNDVIDEAVRDAVGRREAGAQKAEKDNAPKKQAPKQVAVKGSPAPAGEAKEIGSWDEYAEAMGLNN